MSGAIALTAPGALLGEGPLWVAGEGRLYWVDLIGQRLHAHHLASGTNTSWPMPEMIGWIIPCAEPGDFVIGLQSGFARLRLDPFAVTRWVSPHGDRADHRLNDAKADRWGRIWAGSMHLPVTQTTGSLHRLHPGGTIETMDGPYRVPNGPAFTADGRLMYHADSWYGTVQVFELDSKGDIVSRRPFAQVPGEAGKPDGMATDIAGGLWIAQWDGARVDRYRPDGTIDFSISMPVRRPTSICFGGAALDRMFATSASRGDEDNPLAGALFEVPYASLRGHRGHPLPHFGT